MVENTNVEKNVNTTLEEFINKGKLEDKKVVSEEFNEELDESLDEEEAVTTEVVKTEKKEMLDPDDIPLGTPQGAVDFGKYKFDEGDFEEVEIDKKIVKVSKKPYKIIDVDYQQDVVRRNINSAINNFNDAIAQKKIFQSEKAVWTTSRLVLTYEGTDYKSSLPKIKWWIKNFLNAKKSGVKIDDIPKEDIPRPTIQIVSTEDELKSKYTAVTSKLHHKFWQKFGSEYGADTPRKLGFDVFLKGLKGKEVYLMDTEDENKDGQETHRLDIWKFV